MFASSLTAKRFLLKVLPLVAALFLSISLTSLTQAQDAEHQRAIDLFEANNFVEALPLLEKVAAARPNDVQILSRLGFALYANSATEKDPAARQKMRDRARAALTRSRELGDNSNLTSITLDALSGPDASMIPFSNIKTAEAAIREGEAAFVKGDMDAAIAAYKRALDADPHLYDAALYAGDAEFKKAFNSTDQQFRNQHFDAAGVWFAKAIAIDPDRETAHRYWGDALDAQGKTIDARNKFIDAIVAEPYGRRAYVGLTRWGQRHNVSLGHPRIDILAKVDSSKPGEINVTVDETALKSGGSDGSSAWVVYGAIRTTWMNGKDGSRSQNFARAYPNETTYRHSLAEELAALRGVAESLQTQIKENRVKQLTPSLANLKQVYEAGLLEPYILFVLPDDGVVRDYHTYRARNRDKLRRYWLELVLPG